MKEERDVSIHKLKSLYMKPYSSAHHALAQSTAWLESGEVERLRFDLAVTHPAPKHTHTHTHTREEPTHMHISTTISRAWACRPKVLHCTNCSNVLCKCSFRLHEGRQPARTKKQIACKIQNSRVMIAPKPSRPSIGHITLTSRGTCH